jgi:adenylate cyclase
MAEERLQRRLAAILSADVVGYSRLMGIDEAGTLARLKAVRRDLVDPLIAAHSGRTFKLMGDGALVEFGSAVDAVTCAIEVQKQIRERDAGSPEDSRIQFRIGINVGDIIVDGDDIYGDGVNVAARIQALADPGGIYISRGAAEQVRDKVPIKIETRGEQTVKNIARPIEVFCIIADDRDPIVVTVHEAETRVQTPMVADKPSIAVLAFNNMSGDPEQEYFSDGISEDIITDLSKLSELHVIARNSTFNYKGKGIDVKQVGRDLGVRYVLEGSVRKAGNRVRVTGQLIDAANGAHIWADRFDRDLTDIFAVQDELTKEIIAALKVKLTPQQKDRLVRKGTIDIEAYNLFLRGREQMWLHTRSGNLEARNLLGRAIAINPDYAAAHAFVAFTLLNDYINGWADIPEQSLKTALETVGRAVAMDEEDPQAHFAYSAVLLWHREHDRALAEAQRCLALAPGLAEGHLAVAHIQIYSGDAATGLDTIDSYMRLDPHYPEIVLQFVAEARFSLGRFDEAVAALKQRLERNPDSPSAYALLAACYGHLGRIEESRVAWAELMRITPDFSIERRRRILPFRNPDHFEYRIEGMRKAGLPV